MKVKFKIKYKIVTAGNLLGLEKAINNFCDEKDNDDNKTFIENVDIKHYVYKEDKGLTINEKSRNDNVFYAVIRYSEIMEDKEVNENDK